MRVLRNSNCKYSENARNRTLCTYLHVADDEHVRVVGPHGDVGFVQMFQYLDGHARVAELEQLERRRQVELELVNADGHVVRQLRVVQIFGPGIRQRRSQQVEVDRGLYGKRETRARHPRYHGWGGAGKNPVTFVGKIDFFSISKRRIYVDLNGSLRKPSGLN